MEWSDEKCLQLIGAYQQKVLLWQAKHPLHYNKIKKQDAWEEISLEINIECEECKKKMGSLLSSFRRENIKIKKSRRTGSGRDDIYESSWFAFKAMIFLQDKDEPRPRLNTLLENENFDGCAEREAPSVDTILQDTPENGNDTPPPPSVENFDRITSPVRLVGVPRGVPRKSRKRINDERLDKAFSILEASQLQAGRNEESVHDIFCKFVAKKLQAYSPYVSGMVQNDIMKLLIKADSGLYNISNQQLPHTHYPSETFYQYSQQLSPSQICTHSNEQLTPSQTFSDYTQQFTHSQMSSHYNQQLTPSQTFSDYTQQLSPSQILNQSNHQLIPSETSSRVNKSYHELKPFNYTNNSNKEV